MGNITETQYFQAVQDKKMEVSEVLEQVYIALTEKGYNPINQIVGYIMSGDPTYITSHKGWIAIQNSVLLMYHNLYIQSPIPGHRIASSYS